LNGTSNATPYAQSGTKCLKHQDEDAELYLDTIPYVLQYHGLCFTSIT